MNTDPSSTAYKSLSFSLHYAYQLGPVMADVGSIKAGKNKAFERSK